MDRESTRGFSIPVDPGRSPEIESKPVVCRDVEPDETLEFQETHESEVRSYPRRLPLAIKKAEGVWIWDTKGQKYLDFLSGAGVLALGHHHPEIDAEVIKQIANKLPYQSLDLTSPVKNAFLQQLLDFLPEGYFDNPRVQFCGPGGADAIDAAIKLARIQTGRSEIIAFQGGYHGVSGNALAVTGNRELRERQLPSIPGVHFFPFPYSFRCPFGIGGADGARVGLKFLESALDDPASGIGIPAAIILEPIQGEGGVIAAPKSWLQGVRRIAEKHGILLIVDEIQTGIGRTGSTFAFEHAGIRPDILALSKAIGGGLPLSALVFESKNDGWRAGEHCGTFRGNQLAMAAGARTLEIIQRDGLCDHVKAMGKRLGKGLREVAQENPEWVGEVRGRGLMIGMEIIDENGGFGTERASRIQTEALRRGLIIERGGRNGCVVRFLPPLIVDEAQVASCVEIIADSIAASRI
ncbi:MAG: 2,4-diaminobutyrate 4-transaminase [Verrucomicrobiales bacterium]|jgi:2,4-diaminobutyrate 4-transaminase